MAGATVEELYKNYGVIADSGEKASEHEDAYLVILSGVKGDAPEKKLACSFLPKFFKYFPKLADQAIDAQLDLCEDEDPLIRRQAIKSLPELCKDDAEHITRIADILTQLLQTEDENELSITKQGLLQLIRNDPKVALSGIFSQIVGGDDVVRDKGIRFLNYAVITLMKDVFSVKPEAEMCLFDEVKKALSDVTGEEFKIFMGILSKLKSVANDCQKLADLVAEQAELDRDFEPTDADSIDRLITCTRQGIPFFKKGASSEKFYEYLIRQVVPVFDQVAQTDDAGDFKLELIKTLAEISPYVTDELAKESIEMMYNRLLEYMPLPPIEDTEKSEDKSTPEQKLNFSYAECLLFAFHQLAKKNEEFLSGEEAVERLKDFRLRLQYFARELQVYIKQLRMALQGKTGPDLEEEENKIKVVALRTTNNINTLIKDLFHNPPSYKGTITLSWRAPVQKVPESVDERRKRAGITPITFEGGPAKKREGSQVYTPPSRRNGASKGTEMPSGNERGFRSGFRGRGRGRGRSRGQGGRGWSYQNFLFR